MELYDVSVLIFLLADIQHFFSFRIFFFCACYKSSSGLWCSLLFGEKGKKCFFVVHILLLPCNECNAIIFII